MDIETISEYYDVRVALEAAAIELACENMSDETIDKLLEYWDPKNCTMQFDYPDQIREVEESFHMIIAEGGYGVTQGRMGRIRVGTGRRCGTPSDYDDGA